MRFLQRDVLSDDWEKVPSFDVIVSNPPYVTETEKNEMDANVLDWEPGWPCSFLTRILYGFIIV